MCSTVLSSEPGVLFEQRASRIEEQRRLPMTEILSELTPTASPGVRRRPGVVVASPGAAGARRCSGSAA
jgi:hypothetical protein